MPMNEVIKDVQHRMHSAVDALNNHFKTLRTGRANAAMLDTIHVDCRSRRRRTSKSPSPR
jgi:ribosome recycling factor